MVVKNRISSMNHFKLPELSFASLYLSILHTEWPDFFLPKTLINLGYFSSFVKIWCFCLIFLPGNRMSSSKNANLTNLANFNDTGRIYPRNESYEAGS